MNDEGQIRTEEVPKCLFCGTPGTELYNFLKDRLFGAPGTWGFLRCGECGLVWLNPRPLAEDIGKAYRTYYTHERKDGTGSSSLRENAKLALFSGLPGFGGLAAGWWWRQLGKALCSIPLVNEVARIGMMHLDGRNKGRLVEVGCGNGAFLARARKAGWEVQGVEPDPVAAKLVQERLGLPVFAGMLQAAQFSDESFDVVVLSHVIEHVHDPVDLLRECRRILRPGGKVVVVTPNAESAGHRAFRVNWSELDPPRHIHLFSTGTMRACGEQAGLRVDLLRTSERRAWWVWTASRAIQRKGVYVDSDLTGPAILRGVAFQVRERWTRRRSEGAGEELLLIGSCQPSGAPHPRLPSPTGEGIEGWGRAGAAASSR